MAGKHVARLAWNAGCPYTCCTSMQVYRVGSLVAAAGVRTRAAMELRDDRIGLIRDLGPHEPADYAYAVPGFVDIHTHGGSGHDVMDGTAEALDGIAEHHLRRGTTTFLASTLTAPLPRLRAVLAELRRHRDVGRAQAAQARRADLAGVHLEGPWISRANLGAQNPDHVISADDESLALIREYADMVRMVTFSYHDEKARALLRLLGQNGIIAALGHDETLDTDAREAFDAGVTHLTHAFSCSSSAQRRDGVKHLGSLEMALITPGVTVELILDDRHITRPFWDFVRHNKSPAEILAVSDSTRGAGLPEDPGRTYDLGGISFIVDGGVAWLPDRSSYAGSTTSLLRSFRLLVREWGVPMTDAVALVSANPARKLGLYPQIGSLAQGSRADFLLLAEDLSLMRIVKSGRAAAVEPTA